MQAEDVCRVAYGNEYQHKSNRAPVRLLPVERPPPGETERTVRAPPLYAITFIPRPRALRRVKRRHMSIVSRRPPQRARAHHPARAVGKVGTLCWGAGQRCKNALYHAGALRARAIFARARLR